MSMDQNKVERELGWDDTIENDSTGFVVLPAGEYGFTVTSFERKRHDPKPGGKLPACNMAVLDIHIEAPEGSTTLKHNLFLHTRTEGLLCEFFTCIGQRKHGEPLKMNWTAVTGARGRCKIGIRTWKSDRTGEDMQSNEIKSFLEPTDGAATAPTYQAGSF